MKASGLFARMITSLTEEAEAIGWYEQRISLEKDKEAKAIMQDAQKEEFKHFAMDLEFMFRKKGDWKKIAEGIFSKKVQLQKMRKQQKKQLIKIKRTGLNYLHNKNRFYARLVKSDNCRIWCKKIRRRLFQHHFNIRCNLLCFRAM